MAAFPSIVVLPSTTAGLRMLGIRTPVCALEHLPVTLRVPRIVFVGHLMAMAKGGIGLEMRRCAHGPRVRDDPNRRATLSGSRFSTSAASGIRRASHVCVLQWLVIHEPFPPHIQVVGFHHTSTKLDNFLFHQLCIHILGVRAPHNVVLIVAFGGVGRAFSTLR